MADIFLGSTVRPGGPFPIVEDSDTKGGYRIVANHATRDGIIASNRKQGMLVYTLDDGIIWELSSDLATWNPFSNGGAAPAILWLNPTPWSSIYAQVVALGGVVTVVLSDPAGYTIPAGSYNLAGVEFVGYNADANGMQLTFDPGVLLDAGGIVGLNCRGVSVFAQAPLMTANAPKRVIVNLKSNSALVGFAGSNFDMFRPGGSLTASHFFLLEDGQLRNDTGPVIFVNDATSAIQLQMFGGLSSMVVDGQFAGVSGVTFSYYCDALNQDQATRPSLLVSPVVIHPNPAFSQVTSLNFPFRRTVDLPTPSADNIGFTAWDTTLGRPRISNGTTFLDFAFGTTGASNYIPVANLAARDALDVSTLPIGIWVLTLDTGIVYQLAQKASAAGATFLSDNFDSDTANAAVPAPWYSTGTTGTGTATVRTALSITSPVTNSITGQSGTKFLFLGAINGGLDTLIPMNGRTYAKINLDFTAVTPGSPLVVEFYKRQIGDDTIPYDGFDLDVIDTGGTAPPVGDTQLVHEETGNETAWGAKRSFDLSAYIGRTVTLAFSGYDDNAPGDASAVVIDTVYVGVPAVSAAWNVVTFGDGGAYWLPGENFATTVYNRYLANGGVGDILIFDDPTDPAYSPTIPAGSYPALLNARFVGMPLQDPAYGTFGKLRMNLTFASGVTYSSGSQVALRAKNIAFNINSGASNCGLYLNLVNCSILGDTKLFGSVTHGLVYLEDSTIAESGSAVAVIEVGANVVLDLIAKGSSKIGDRAFGGIASTSQVRLVSADADTFPNIYKGGFEVESPAHWYNGVAPYDAVQPTQLAHDTNNTSSSVDGLLHYNTNTKRVEVSGDGTWFPVSQVEISAVSDGALVSNTFVKGSSTTDDRVVQFLAGDDPFLIVGVVLDDAFGAGTTVRVARRCGQRVLIKSDGVSAINRTNVVDVSTTSNGRVTLGVGGAQVSTARTSVAATADVLVAITF